MSSFSVIGLDVHRGEWSALRWRKLVSSSSSRRFSRAHSVSKSIAKTARTRGRLFCFTFETVFYKFARLVSRTSANVMMRIDRVVFFALPEWRRRRRISFFFPSAQSVVEATEFFFILFSIFIERENNNTTEDNRTFVRVRFARLKRRRRRGGE